jgi:hypothetical protein
MPKGSQLEFWPSVLTASRNAPTDDYLGLLMGLSNSTSLVTRPPISKTPLKP